MSTTPPPTSADYLLAKLTQPGAVLCRLPDSPRWGLFTAPLKEIVCCDLQEIPAALQEVERETQVQGHYVAGFLSYEAAPAFDEALVAFPLTDFPYCWFGVFENCEQVELPAVYGDALPSDFFGTSDGYTPQDYENALQEVERQLRAGNTYQVNYSFRLTGPPIPNPAKLFLTLAFASHSPYAAYVNTGDEVILSLSPELFLEKCGRKIASRPMKGTAARALLASDDQRDAQKLAKDEKNLAENIMIVDMVRNDLNRICLPESVGVTELFTVETYPTVHQMVSQVEGELPAEQQPSLLAVLRATFPPASVTGTPKPSAVSIIHALEREPRKVYTGTIGCVTKGGDFTFNVAIRTILAQEQSELRVGSGLVMDSLPKAEWEECLSKSRFATQVLPEFCVLETMRYEKKKGILWRSEHLARAKSSQLYFGRRWNEESVLDALQNAEEQLQQGDASFANLRLLIDLHSNPTCEVHTKLAELGWGDKALRVLISPTHVESTAPFLFHKTTHREFYNTAYQQAKQEGFDEVLFCNERGELTEGAISSVALKLGGVWRTPTLASGLLPGIWRANWLQESNALEERLPLESLRSAEEILLGNSVRGAAKVGKIVFENSDRSDIEFA